MPKTSNKITGDRSEAHQELTSRETLVAQAATRPTFPAANTISAFNQVIGAIDLIGMANELEERGNCIQKDDLSRIEDTLAA